MHYHCVMSLLKSSREVSPEALSLGKILWNYHQMNHKLVKSDVILTLGSHDLRVADRAAELYHEGWAPLLVFSGGLGNFTAGMWTEAEADRFASIAMSLGVPADAILIENRSSNTGENIMFTEKLLQERGLKPTSFIVVQKPYMERRAYATFKKHWPDKDVVVTSPQISYETYPIEEIPIDRLLDIMAGDLQRIKEYPAKGFQIHQEIPPEVWDAYERLATMGFDRHLMK